MQGYQLEFFTEQNKRHGHQTLYEWLLETAHEQEIPGATVFMGAMGYGHQRRLHAAHFFELGDQPVEVAMVVTAEQAERLFDVLKRENVHLFYVKIPVEFGESGESANS